MDKRGVIFVGDRGPEDCVSRRARVPPEMEALWPSKPHAGAPKNLLAAPFGSGERR